MSKRPPFTENPRDRKPPRFEIKPMEVSMFAETISNGDLFAPGFIADDAPSPKDAGYLLDCALVNPESMEVTS